MRPFFGIKPVLLDAEVRGSSVCRGVCVYGGQNPPTGKGQIRIMQWHPACRRGSGHRCCVRAENPPGYFVAAAASQIAQTVGAMRSEFGSHRISCVVDAEISWFSFPLRETYRAAPTRPALCV